MKFIFLLLFVSAPALADPCQEIRGSLDIGPASTKALAALVDVCKKEIVKVIFEAQAPADFAAAVEKAADKKLSPAALDEAAPKIKELVDKMKEKNAQHILALAGSALRAAANGAEAAGQLGARIGAPVRVLTAEEESQLGYLAALEAHKIPLTAQEGVAVWNISAGGTEIRAESGGDTQRFAGAYTPTSFKDKVVEDIQKKDAGSSPNPLGRAANKAANLAEKEARSAPAYFRKKRGPKRWLGVGDVLALSMQAQVKKKAHAFTVGEVEAALKKRSALNDEKLGGDSPATDVTNLALVLGYMRALGIRRVETAAASLNQGHLLLQLFNPLRDAPAPAATAPSATATATSTATQTSKE